MYKKGIIIKSSLKLKLSIFPISVPMWSSLNTFLVGVECQTFGFFLPIWLASHGMQRRKKIVSLTVNSSLLSSRYILLLFSIFFLYFWIFLRNSATFFKTNYFFFLKCKAFASYFCMSNCLLWWIQESEYKGSECSISHSAGDTSDL